MSRRRELAVVERVGDSGSGQRRTLLQYVPAGAAEVTIRGRLYRRTDRVTRAGAAVFEAADVG